MFFFRIGFPNSLTIILLNERFRDNVDLTKKQHVPKLVLDISRPKTNYEND